MRFLAVDLVDGPKESVFGNLAMEEKHRERREAWLGLLKKTRVIDSDFRNQIMNDRVFTRSCILHLRMLRYVSIFLQFS